MTGRPRAVGPAARLVAALLVAGCGAGGASHPRSASACAATVTATLEEVASRVYREAAQGADASESVRRVQASAALVDAAARGDRRAVVAALSPLLEGEIVRIRILRAGKVVADVGRQPAFAPVSGVLRDAHRTEVASFVLSVQSEGGFAAVVSRLASSPVVVRSGSRIVVSTLSRTPRRLPGAGPFVLAGRRFEAVSFTATAYPGGALLVTLLVPQPVTGCASRQALTRANTLGQVSQRIYGSELAGSAAQATLQLVEHFRPLVAAVAGADAAAARAAIIALFKSHLHVVRVRVLSGSRVIADVGGPDVLAPLAGPLRDARGRSVGGVLVAIQDDSGYLKLVQRFTGADVLLGPPRGGVIGTLAPLPAALPNRGPVAYGSRRFTAFSFTGEAFPAGTLRISILIPAPELRRRQAGPP